MSVGTSGSTVISSTKTEVHLFSPTVTSAIIQESSSGIN